MIAARLALGASVLVAASGVGLRAYGGALACPDALCLAVAPSSLEGVAALSHRVLALTAGAAGLVALVRAARAQPLLAASGAVVLGLSASAGIWAHSALLAPVTTGAHLGLSVAWAGILALLAWPSLAPSHARGAAVAAIGLVAASSSTVGAGAYIACGAWPLCAADAPAIGWAALGARAAWVSLAVALGVGAFRWPHGPGRDAAHLLLRLVGLVIGADLAVVLAGSVPELAVAQVVVLHLLVASIAWSLAETWPAEVMVRRAAPTPSPSPAVRGAGAPTS